MNKTPFDIVHNEEYTTVIIRRCLDARVVIELREEVEKFIDDSDKAMIVDLSEVTRIDSSGLGFVVFYLNNFKSRGRRCGIVGVSGQVRELMQLTKLEDILPIFSSVKSFMESE